MKKAVSLSRMCLTVCIITLLSTAVLTSTFSGLLPIFGFVMLLAVIPLARGNRTQKIVAAVILAIAATAASFAFLAYKSERQRFERARVTQKQQQISAEVQSDNSL